MGLSEPFDDLLSKACEEYLSDPANIVLPERTVELTADEIHQLAEKILLLPPDLHDILFFRYLFNFSPENTEVMLEVTDAKPKLYFAQEILSQAMGLGDAEIGVDSMTAACKLAMEHYTAPPDVLETPRYSAKFRSSLRKIKAARPPRPRSSPRSFAQRAAMFALCVIVGGASIFFTNADLGEDFFYWVKKTYEKFSIFEPETSKLFNEDQFEIDISYIPEDFFLDLEDNHNTHTTLIYRNNDNGKITINIATSAIYYDTQGADLQTTQIGNSFAYWWQKDDFTYFVFDEDNLSCYISANLPYEVVFKIAENINITA